MGPAIALELRAHAIALEQRRSTLINGEDAGIKPTRVSGFQIVVGEGETAVRVDFPVWYVEKPSMSFGGELAENEFVENLKYPTVSVVVIEWVKTLSERLGGGYWTGAVLACVTTGKPAQRMIVHWQAEAKALANPASGGGTGL